MKKLLQDIYVFKNFPANKIDFLAEITQERVYNPGDLIIRENEEADAMFVVQYGSLKLIKRTAKGDEQVVGQLGSGNHFGELPFVDQLKRALTIEAVEKTALLEIKYSDLKKLLENDTTLGALFYREIAHFLAVRLRQITEDLTFARERNLKHF